VERDGDLGKGSEPLWEVKGRGGEGRIDLPKNVLLPFVLTEGDSGDVLKVGNQISFLTRGGPRGSITLRK